MIAESDPASVPNDDTQPEARANASDEASEASEGAPQAKAPRKRASAKKAAEKADAKVESKADAKDKPKLTKTADRLAKLGLKSAIDLVLHLPMRYEDETTLTPIGELLPGGVEQTEGVVFDNEVAYRPRRQLVVKLRDHNGDELHLRFLNFYGSQVAQMAVGKRLRVRGDVRGGFFGMEMVHPAVKVV